MTDAWREPTAVIAWTLFASVIAYHGTNLLMMLAAAAELFRQRRDGDRIPISVLKESPRLPGISVIIPAFNEEVAIARTVASVLKTDYPDLEVIVVSDGSTDGTLRVLLREFDLRPAFELVVEESELELRLGIVQAG